MTMLKKLHRWWLMERAWAAHIRGDDERMFALLRRAGR